MNKTEDCNYHIILYGVGGFLKGRVDEIFNSLPKTVIIGLTDSNSGHEGEVIKGYTVSPYYDLVGLDYDFFVITSTYAVQIKRLLIERGIKQDRILNYYEYKSLVCKPIIEVFNKLEDPYTYNYKGSVLIITRNLDFTGSSMAMYYATLALKSRGYRVVIQSATYDPDFLSFLLGTEVEIRINSHVGLDKKVNDEISKGFDSVVINTYWMHQCIIDTDDRNYTMWLHEPTNVFEDKINFWGLINQDIEKVKIYGVSRIACENFNKFYPGINTEIMEYGLVDSYPLYNIERLGKLTIAVIGTVYEIKGQDIFLDAIEKLRDDIRKKCDFLIVGRISSTDYCMEILSRAEKIPQIKVMGEMTHEEILHLYNKIDILVSSSREDMLPIVVVEGMMMKKLCVIPDSIGLTDYITDGVEAIEYRTSDSDDLCNKLEKLFDGEYDNLAIEEAARRLYLSKFSMESFADRLEQALGVLEI